MWEFVAQKFVQPPRWTWARVNESGRTIQKSMSTYPSLGHALANAMAFGLEGGKDQIKIVELE